MDFPEDVNGALSRLCRGMRKERRNTAQAVLEPVALRPCLDAEGLFGAD
jgi:hypothetical protein